MNKRTRANILNLIAIVGIYLVVSLLINSGVLSRGDRSTLMDIGIAVIMAVSLNLTTGFLGQLALGHAGFMAIGAYTSALMTKNLALPMAAAFPLSLL